MSETRTIRVRCTFELSVEVPAEWDDDLVQFDIEENHCPGTGAVGHALEALIADATKRSVCWACPTGKNEIIEGAPHGK